jgi:hypothetical protein
MSPVIRVDDEVLAWLTKQATPFVDTPNSVLRRVARLDKDSSMHSPHTSGRSRPTHSSLERVTGAQLNRRYRLGVRHALYHKDGTFFEVLQQFPGALCDSKGFVRFETREQYERDPHLAIGNKTNVHRGIAAHPRYRRFDTGK